MTDQGNMDQAISLTDEMVSLSDGERYILRKHIIKAAQGSDAALGHIILFPHSCENFDIVGRILRFILGD